MPRKQHGGIIDRAALGHFLAGVAVRAAAELDEVLAARHQTGVRAGLARGRRLLAFDEHDAGRGDKQREHKMDGFDFHNVDVVLR